MLIPLNPISRIHRAIPHAGIRVALKQIIEESWFERFDLRGAEVPMTVAEALKRV